jgi:hypothetical protein
MGRINIALGCLVCLASCHKSPVGDSSSADAELFAAAAPEGDLAAGAEVPPPAPVVAEDPAIPVNEAVVGTAPIPPDYAAPVAPPEPVVEDQPTQPEPDDVWIPGYWWWSVPLGRYVWVSGAWRRPPPEQVWTPGSWGLVGARFVWTPGYWGPHGYARVMVDIAPPIAPVEPYIAPPGVGFVWTPGYYSFRGGNYVWVGGSWLRPPSPGFGWVEPRYVEVGGRYWLQPGRWDFPPARRGVVYRPDIDVRPGAHVRLAPLPSAVVVAHAKFVSTSAHAIARGAVRTPTGGFVMPHNAAPPHANPAPAHEAFEPHGATRPEGNEQHELRGETRPTEGNEPHEVSHEPQRAPAPKGEVEHGAAPRVNVEPHEQIRHEPAPAPQPHSAPAEHNAPTFHAAPTHAPERRR